jgi:hypothetical protein
MSAEETHERLPSGSRAMLPVKRMRWSTTASAEVSSVQTESRRGRPPLLVRCASA